MFIAAKLVMSLDLAAMVPLFVKFKEILMLVPVMFTTFGSFGVAFLLGSVVVRRQRYRGLGST